MPAILKSATILSGLALTGAAAYSTTKRSSSDFSPAATMASEIDASGKAPSKPKLYVCPYGDPVEFKESVLIHQNRPSEFFHFQIGKYEFRN